VEGITLRGDRRSGRTLYYIYKEGLFSENRSDMNQVRKLEKDLVDKKLDYERYFGEIPLNRQLPWYHVRPSVISSQLDKRYRLLKNKQ
jgi:hypothetical protein